MSFAPFENIKDNLDKFKAEKMNKKVRFSNDEKKKFSYDNPGFWNYDEKSNIIDAESNLIKSSIGTRQKTKVEMIKELHPNNYDISVGNVIETKQNEKFYYPAYFTGPGAGFGNVNLGSSIRVGDFTRLDKNNKIDNESKVVDRWEFIDDRFAKSKNLVMEMPRGGDSTRKLQNDLNNTNNRLNEDKEFNFQY